MKLHSFVLFLFFAFVVAAPMMAQQPQTQQQNNIPIASDTVEPPPSQQELANKKIMNREPNKAALMSALLPGAGQIHNKHFWKAPIVWIGLGVTGYLIYDFSDQVKTYGDAAALVQNKGNIYSLDNNYHGYNLQTLTATQLTTLQDDARRFVYMNALFFTGIYALNIVDAYVDAHLKEFDVNENLSFRVKPLFYATNYSHLATGLTLSIRLK